MYRQDDDNIDELSNLFLQSQSIGFMPFPIKDESLNPMSHG